MDKAFQHMKTLILMVISCFISKKNLILMLYIRHFYLYMYKTYRNNGNSIGNTIIQLVNWHGLPYCLSPHTYGTIPDPFKHTPHRKKLQAHIEQ